jgi:ArsR family transcriptional regulator
MPSSRQTTAPDAAGLIEIYQCLCDETRLRILNLLTNAGQLCVCHFQEILGKTQVHISKHLSYLKVKGLVESTKHANWMIYRLPDQRSVDLNANLRCLQDCVQTHAVFKEDLARLRKMQPKLSWLCEAGTCSDEAGCAEPAKKSDPVLGGSRQSKR